MYSLNLVRLISKINFRKCNVISCFKYYGFQANKQGYELKVRKMSRRDLSKIEKNITGLRSRYWEQTGYKGKSYTQVNIPGIRERKIAQVSSYNKSQINWEWMSFVVILK